jgi:transposase
MADRGRPDPRPLGPEMSPTGAALNAFVQCRGQDALRLALQDAAADTVALLRSLRERITTIESRIEQALTDHPDATVFTSLPRSGSVRAATLLAEIGDARGRYPTDEALAAAAGISLSTRASGRSHYVVFRRGCNHRLRQALIDFADGSRAANPWAQDVYARARARARGHNHAHAVRVLARAWLRIIWRCWTDHTPYDPDRHLALVELQQQPDSDHTEPLAS